jgi:hypothetical protein
MNPDFFTLQLDEELGDPHRPPARLGAAMRSPLDAGVLTTILFQLVDQRQMVEKAVC